jgi:hypothetical protein
MANRSDRGGEAPSELLAFEGRVSIGSPPADPILARSRGLHQRAEDTTAVQTYRPSPCLELN